MTIKLSDTELALLSAAATRDDKCVSLPAKLSAARLGKISDKLIEAGFAREVKAKATSPVWRRDDEAEVSYALKLTAAGIKSAREGEAKMGSASESLGRSNAAKRERDSPNVSSAASGAIPSTDTDPIVHPSAPAPRTTWQAPRSGSKIAKVIELLCSDNGVAISELMEATGWLPHTTRAALTGLRKRGHSIVLDRSDKEQGSVYRLGAKSAASEPTPGKLVVEAP